MPAPKMQTINCLVALGGDKGNLVPKYAITVSEMQVLRLIHGSDACTEIEPAGEIDVEDGVEIERLLRVFQRPAGVISPVKTMYPGGRAQVHRHLEHVPDLDQTWLKATARVSLSGVSGTEALTLEKLADAEAEIAELKRRVAELAAIKAAEEEGAQTAEGTLAPPVQPEPPATAEAPAAGRAARVARAAKGSVLG